jgi:hypothetical protein
LLDSKKSVVFDGGNMAKVCLDNSLYDAMRVLARVGDGVEFSGVGHRWPPLIVRGALAR